MTEKKQSLHDAAEALLEGAEAIMRHKVNRALGKPSDLDMSLVNDKEHEKVWNMLVPMIQSLAHRQEMEVQSASDIITLLSKGKITITEAKEMMLLFKMQADVTTLEKGGNRSLLNVLLEMSSEETDTESTEAEELTSSAETETKESEGEIPSSDKKES